MQHKSFIMLFAAAIVGLLVYTGTAQQRGSDAPRPRDGQAPQQWSFPPTENEKVAQDYATAAIVVEYLREHEPRPQVDTLARLVKEVHDAMD